MYEDINQRIEESKQNGSVEEVPVITKSWGREIWVINKEYCGKILELNEGWDYSLHHHKNKDEVFLVVEGKVYMIAEDKEWVMLPGNIQYINPEVKHRFIGLDSKGSKIIEFMKKKIVIEILQLGQQAKSLKKFGEK